MLNFNSFKVKTSIKIVAAFLVILQAVFLLQKVFAVSPSILTVKPLTDGVGFNLIWSFANNDSSATYYLLKSTVDNLSCPLAPSAPADISGDKISYGKNTTVYNYNWSDITAIALDTKYFFKACLYGNGFSGITNSFALLEETTVVSEVFTVASSSLTNIIPTIPINPISTSTLMVSTTTPASQTLAVETKNITLSNVDKDLYWQANGYFAHGFYVLWSKTENPSYHSGTVGITYFADPLAKFYTIDPYDGTGVYFVRVCEALMDGGCDLYSNQLNLNLFVDVVATTTTTTTTTTLATSTVAKEMVDNLPINDIASSAVQEMISTSTDNITTTTPIKLITNLSEEISTTTATTTVLEQDVSEKVNGVMSVGALKESLAISADVISLRDETTSVKVLKSASSTDYQDNKIASIIAIDSDGDGLPDDVENKIGTDPNNNDTDGDNYSDYMEYASGHNPLGNGNLETINKLAPVEVAIVNDEIFEQPKVSGAIHEDFVTESVSNIGVATSTEADGYLLQGKATPNTVVALYIYSNLPLLLIVKTDDYGNWKYELKHALADGEHEVYVVLNDSAGKIIAKGSPFHFFIKEAKAAAVTDVPTISVTPTIQNKSNNTFIYYLLISGALVLVGIGMSVYLIKRKRNLNI